MAHDIKASKKPNGQDGQTRLTLANLRAASALVERATFATMAGITFGGDRDVFQALGYKKKLTATDYRDRYERNGVAARIVEALPDNTWRGEGELVEEESPGRETKFEKAWEELTTLLPVWPMMRRADILAGLGRYAVLLIGFPGDLKLEAEKVQGPEGVLYLRAYAEDDAAITEIETDATSPRFGLPTLYKIKRLTPAITFGGASSLSEEKEVHWSRVIHVADGLLDDDVYGEPRLRRGWNLLDDLEKVTGAGAEAFWRRANPGIQFDLDKDLEIDEDGEKLLTDEVDEFVHDPRRALRTRGMTVKMLEASVAQFGANVSSIMDLLSTSYGIPKRILTGSERGELASTEDRSNWADRVAERRSAFAEPQVVDPFVGRLVTYGALPKPASFAPRWPEVDTMDEDDRAGLGQTLAEMNKAQVEAEGELVVTANEIRDRVFNLEPHDEPGASAGEEAPAAASGKPGAQPGTGEQTGSTLPSENTSPRYVV